MPILSRPSLLVLAAAPAPAKPNPKKAAQASKAALALVDQFVIPAYRNLVQGCEAQEKAWTAFARLRETGDFASLRAAYNSTADSWANAQFIKTGPITLFLRYDRFAYWPEARNATSRALDQLLASANPKDLQPDSLAHDSVAGQGLTALERLLYDGDDPAALLKAPGKDGAWRTQVGLGIAHNLTYISRDVLKDWTAPDGVRAAIMANKGWKNLFADAPEAARLLLTDLVAGFKLMHDVKLLPVLGANAGAAKPKSAEAWRSARSQRDLKLNLAAAQGMTGALADVTPAHRAKIDGLLANAAKAIDAVPADLGEAAADPKRRGRVDAARVAIKAAQTEIAKTLPGDVGVTLGFNSLDGD